MFLFLCGKSVLHARESQGGASLKAKCSKDLQPDRDWGGCGGVILCVGSQRAVCCSLSGLATEESQSRKKRREENEINFIITNLLGNMQLFVSQYEN